MDHDHARSGDFGRAFAVGIALNLAYVALEAGFGVFAGSLALLADAGHNLSDVLGLALAWGADRLARRPPTPRRTYGFKRVPILASLANAVLLLVAVGAIVLEAARRLAAPEPVATGLVIWVAAAGVAVNTATALLFLSGRKGDLNIRGAFLHMAADAGVTVGVIVAALGIAWTGWLWLDPAVGLLIAAAILAGTWGLLRESAALAADAVPPGIDVAEVRAFLEGQAGVRRVHDLHVWALGTTEVALTAHLEMPGGHPGDRFLDALQTGLAARFGIGHATFQVETAIDCACRLAPDHPV